MRRSFLAALAVAALALVAAVPAATTPDALAPPAWYETPAFVIALFAGLLALVAGTLAWAGRA